VSTRVVSWNDAAEMNERVCSEALVMLSSTGWPVVSFSALGLHPALTRRARSCRSARPDQLGLACLVDLHLSIWRTITRDVLVVDRHALQPVDS
jgi:hypothetical protein